MRGDARGLVDEQDAVRGRRDVRRGKLLGELAAQERHELGELQVGREAGGPPVPAAALRAGDRETSTRSSVARSETLRRVARVLGEQLAHEPGDGGPLDRAQVVDDALGVALVGAGDA